MTIPPRLKKLTLSGFRAYLSEQPIDFGKNGSSLVVVAPNGKGKSSLVDAMEFVFSKDGFVERLGKVRSGTQAGKEALVHHAATKANISPFVKVEFIGAAQVQPFSRSAKTPEVIPDDLATALEAMKVPYIIRGFELRKFVEATSPSDRYEAVSNWFGFNPLLKTQDSLRELRVQLNRALNDQTQLDTINGEVKRLTNSQEQQWNEVRCVAWFNDTILTPLDNVLKVDALDSCAGIKKVLFDRAAEALSNESSVLNKTITDKIKQTLGNKVEKVALTVATFSTCNTAIESYKKAQELFSETKNQSEKAIFADVWREAELLFKSPTIQLDNCPVCETPITQTPSKSVDGIKVTLENSLKHLTTYYDTEKALKASKMVVETKIREVKDCLNSILDLLKQTSSSIDLQPIQEAATACDKYTYSGSPIKFDLAQTTLQTLLEHLSPAIPKPQEVGKPTWKSGHDALEKLTGLKERADYEVRRKSEVQKIHDAVVKYASIVDTSVKSYVETLISTLTDKINFFYNEIQTGVEGVPVIHLSFPPGDKKIQHQLDLLIDFAEGRKSVPPAGYLSDSQVHTLALAIRLASICMFNKGFPIIVLDDVVTSYDADRRKAVVDVIATHLSGFQVFILTHDEQFYRFLEDQLTPTQWRFKRISRLDKTFGPRYSDHQVLDHEIEELHRLEQSAANLMRQAEEEWLNKIGRDFGVSIRIREIGKEHSHQRHELALALHTFLENRSLFPPTVPGHQNPFLLSLQRGLIENFGSHFQSDPNSWGSVGDEKIRWRNFKEFREKFACTSCKGKRFKRPDSLNKPVCKAQGCEDQFAFT
ncbi:MAG: AAA family ATPase [Xanthomonadaceae bacterium]|nr:AAA family ATPase [Xanthomonadaceae bacterium]